jgi:hypothetical protein
MHDPATQADGTSRCNPHRRQKNIPTRPVTGRYKRHHMTTTVRPKLHAVPTTTLKAHRQPIRNTTRSNPGK